MGEIPLQRYTGKGETQHAKAPDYSPAIRRDPKGYVALDGLPDAVNVAIHLGMPLLVTGDPGTGKTELAYSVAWEMGLPEPIIFNAKTTSAAQDLFYHYDALAHFQAAHVANKDVKAHEYIYAQGLGLAILLSLPRTEKADSYLKKNEVWFGKGPLRTVVLIDEIDKAPRDLPNDILNEIDRMQFRVTQTGDEFKAEGGAANPYRPIVILTSNSEKHLPDAFLRRCVYYNIPFPEDDTKLTEILSRRVTLRHFNETQRKSALGLFREIRKLDLSRKPATAELLNWLVVLDRDEETVKKLSEKPDLAGLKSSYTLLVKNTDDLKRVYAAFGIPEESRSTV